MKLPNKAYRIIIGVAIGIFVVPTIAIGGSIAVSLIQGRGVPEAIQILSEQIDALRGRVEVLETTQQQEASEVGDEKEGLEKEVSELITDQKPTDKGAQAQQAEFDRLMACTDANNLLNKLRAICGNINRLVGVDDCISSLQRQLIGDTGLTEYMRQRTQKGLDDALEFRSQYKTALQQCEGISIASVLKATGIIAIYNDYSSDPQTLVEATRFVYSNGLLFRTVKTVIVPGNNSEGCIGSTTAIVKAEQLGDEYLLKCSQANPCTFTIPGFKGTPKYNSNYGKSFSDYGKTYSDFSSEEVTNFEQTSNICAPTGGEGKIYQGSPPMLW